jgi:hypothetical protein
VRNSGAARGSSAPGYFPALLGEQIAGHLGMIWTTAFPGDHCWTGLICALETSGSTRPPHLARPVDLAVLLVHAGDLGREPGIAHRPRRSRPLPGRVVGAGRDRRRAVLAQDPADRLDPELAAVLIDVSNRGGQWRPSSEAKKALAVRKIAFARRSSALSRSSWRIQAASPSRSPAASRNRPGPASPSRAACRG